MTDFALWTDDVVLGPREGSTMAQYGGHSDGWVVPSTETLIADEIPDLAAGPYDAFAYQGATGLDVTFGSGEAVIAGSPVARDDQTTVTLASDESEQTLLVGYEPLTNDEVRIGSASDFSTDARTIALWEFTVDTGAGTVTGDTSLRSMDESIEVPNERYETSDGSGTAVDAAETASTAGDASNLGGSPPSDYAKQDSAVNFSSVRVVQGGFGVQLGVGGSGNRFFIAPILGGSPEYGEEITYLPDDEIWSLEGGAVLPSAGQATQEEQAVSMVDANRFGSATLPITRIPANQRARHIFASTPGFNTVHIIRASLIEHNDSSVPNGVRLEIKDGGGGQSYTQTNLASTGTYSNPIHTMNGLGTVRVEINNTTGSTQTIAAQVDYVLD